MDNANDNPSRPLGPRHVRALYGFLPDGSDELTFYDRELELRCIEAAPAVQRARQGGDAAR